MKALVVALTTIVVAMTTGCATTNELNQTLRVKELEAHIAGTQDDNAMLMNVIAEQQAYIRELEMGAAMQADAIAKLRDGNCEI